MVNKAWEIQKIQRHWMNNAIGCIIVLLLSIITFFLNLESLQLSVITMVFCFLSVIGAKISFARADFHAKSYEMVLERMHVMAETGLGEDTSRSGLDLEQEVIEVKQLEDEMNLESISDDTEELPLNADVIQLKEVEEMLTNEVLILSNENQFTENNEMVNSIIDGAEQVERLPLEARTVEEDVYQKVQHILELSQRDISDLSTKKVGNYLDVLCHQSLLRLKLNGRKQYILANLSKEEIMKRGLTYELPAKNENYSSRIAFTSPEILHQIEDYILEQYDLAQ